MKGNYGGRALQAVVALAQRPEGLRLTELNEAIDAPLTSAQRALESLRIGKLVDAVSQPGEDRRYRLNSEHPAVDEFARYAERALPMGAAMDIAVRSSRSVQFAGSDEHGYLIVASPFDEPSERLRLVEALDRITRDRNRPIVYEILEREDVRERLREGDNDLRRRGLGLRVVKGSAVRAFRDPRRRGRFDAPALHRVHPSLSPIPHRAIQELARRHGLEKLLVFGSAVREDFGPESDVDVLIYPPREGLGMAALIDLREQLEQIFGRDVDLATPRNLDSRMARQTLDSAVQLYGPA
jgi:uncharacterized protein